MKCLGADLRYSVAEILLRELEDKDKHDVARSTLLALRSTSPDLATSTVIKSAVFKEIRIRATERHVTAVHAANPNFLAPFVQKVTFLPSTDHLYISDDDLVKFFHAKDKNATEAAITKQITDHRRRAAKDRDLFNNGVIVNVWSTFLGQLWSVETFSISSLLGDHPLLPDAMQSAEFANEYADLMNILCKSSFLPHAEFMDTILQCLGSMHSKVHTLEIEWSYSA
ncbi:hypothetical protein H2200_005987 [Cladophialophora chaetospira]|uniref:Uncharacterized protein n=1 Tax=Cladophialophora chaetospira TaxID=386627 RepID=A0AA39CIP4_9EURO|nr:hypothetical protein H2200_005987 [Cladophialophora chaetospira]